MNYGIPQPNPLRMQSAQQPMQQGAPQQAGTGWPSVGQALGGIFSKDLLPMYLGMAMGGTKSDQAKLASQGAQSANELDLSRNQMAQQQSQFDATLAQNQSEAGALKSYRDAMLQMEREKMSAPGAPLSAIGKLRSDLLTGRISQQDFDQEVGRLMKSNQTMNINVPSGWMPVTDEAGNIVGTKPIPGGPATQIPGELAGKAALAKTARQEFSTAKEFYKEGGYDKWDRARDAGIPLAGRPFSGGESGRARRSVQLSVEAALRLATGAAAPEGEVARYTDMFAPAPTDTQETINQKLGMLERFITNAEEMSLRGRGGDAPSDAVTGSIPMWNVEKGAFE